MAQNGSTAEDPRRRRRRLVAGVVATALIAQANSAWAQPASPPETPEQSGQAGEEPSTDDASVRDDAPSAADEEGQARSIDRGAVREERERRRQQAARDWALVYEAARQMLVRGEYEKAERTFRALKQRAPTEAQRILAAEMERVADDANVRRTALPPPKAYPPPPDGEDKRTTDEITLLYATSFVYGVGTGAWFLLQTRPDSALTATIPFAAFSAAPVIALATVDGNWRLPRGLPHGIAAGLYVGLGEAAWAVGYQHAVARRLDPDRTTGLRWGPAESSSVLWIGSTMGGLVGGALATAVPVTPGRISYTASTSIWAGLLTGFTIGAVLPDNDQRAEHAYFAGGLGYNVGMLGGLMSAGSVSPSVSRVRLIDLSGVAGGLVVGGAYAALARGEGDRRTGLGLTAIGVASGLAAGWVLTSGMARDYPTGRGADPHTAFRPSISPVQGGAVVGVGGAF